MSVRSCTRRHRLASANRFHRTNAPLSTGAGRRHRSAAGTPVYEASALPHPIKDIYDTSSLAANVLCTILPAPATAPAAALEMARLRSKTKPPSLLLHGITASLGAQSAAHGLPRRATHAAASKDASSRLVARSTAPTHHEQPCLETPTLPSENVIARRVVANGGAGLRALRT